MQVHTKLLESKDFVPLSSFFFATTSPHMLVFKSSCHNLGPSNLPLSVPSAMIVYVALHSSSLIVTLAFPLVIGALPDK